MSAETQPAEIAQEIGPVTLQEERLIADAKRFRIVAIIAAALLAPQVVGHLLISSVVFPTFQQMFADMGGELPGPTQLLFSLGPLTGILLAAIDALIFWGCHQLARKYWIGLLFVPLFAVGAISAVIVQLMYLPMFSVISLVQ